MADYSKIPEVARRLDVSEKTARRLVTSGGLPSVFIGGAYRVSEDDLVEYLRQAEVKTGKDEAPSTPGQLEYEPDFETPVPTEAKKQMNEVASDAQKLATEWNQEIEFYAKHGKDLPKLRPRGMRLEAVGVSRIYKKALAILQRDAIERGHPSDLSTLPPSEKKAFMSHLAALTALNELALRIEEVHSSAQDARATRAEFEGLDESLSWMVEGQAFQEELTRNREMAGVA